MTMDSRFPTLKRPGECRDLFNQNGRGYMREVERRTGTTAIVNTAGIGRVIFRYGMNISGPLAVSIPELNAWNGGHCDAAVKYIQMGKLSREEKDAIAEQNKRSEDSDRESFEERVLAGAEPNARDYVAHKDRERRGVAKVTVA